MLIDKIDTCTKELKSNKKLKRQIHVLIKINKNQLIKLEQSINNLDKNNRKLVKLIKTIGLKNSYNMQQGFKRKT